MAEATCRPDFCGRHSSVALLSRCFLVRKLDVSHVYKYTPRPSSHGKIDLSIDHTPKTQSPSHPWSERRSALPLHPIIHLTFASQIHKANASSRNSIFKDLSEQFHSCNAIGTSCAGSMKGKRLRVSICRVQTLNREALADGFTWREGIDRCSKSLAMTLPLCGFILGRATKPFQSNTFLS
jgi:hypothetical protein